MVHQDIEPVFRIAWVTCRVQIAQLHQIEIDDWDRKRRDRLYRAYCERLKDLDLSDFGGLRRASEEAKQVIYDELQIELESTMARKQEAGQVVEKAQIRWLIRRDMDDVLRIERESFVGPWTEDDLLSVLRNRAVIGTVIETGNEIKGFMVYELHKERLELLNMAVDPAERRKGYGRQMIQRLIDKLSQQRRRSVEVVVRESNVNAQLFFSSLGFRSVRIHRKHFDDVPEDGYRFRYSVDGQAVGG
jgi:ribosomal-protein-alanine N-acetyltransferase